MPAHAHWRPGDGYIYEDEYSYLERLDLLFAEEKAIFKKYDSVINVYIQQGERGKCVPCWERAREIAKKIDFDLDGAMQYYEFWIPGDLYISCEHLAVQPRLRNFCRCRLGPGARVVSRTSISRQPERPIHRRLRLRFGSVKRSCGQMRRWRKLISKSNLRAKMFIDGCASAVLRVQLIRTARDVEGRQPFIS